MNRILQVLLFFISLTISNIIIAQKSESLFDANTLQEQKSIVVDGKTFSPEKINDFKKKYKIHGEKFLNSNPEAKMVLSELNKNSAVGSQLENTKKGTKEKAKKEYQNSTINTITSRKDELIRIYGSLKAARKSGATVTQPIQENQLQKQNTVN